MAGHKVKTILVLCSLAIKGEPSDDSSFSTGEALHVGLGVGMNAQEDILLPHHPLLGDETRAAQGVFLNAVGNDYDGAVSVGCHLKSHTELSGLSCCSRDFGTVEKSRTVVYRGM